MLIKKLRLALLLVLMLLFSGWVSAFSFFETAADSGQLVSLEEIPDDGVVELLPPQDNYTGSTQLYGGSSASYSSTSSLPEYAGVATPQQRISMLARSLEHDVDKIYKYVYEIVKYEPTFGSVKGAFGALIDQRGNAFDQASLMIALLRESGYQASFVLGKVQVDSEQGERWLGVANLAELRRYLVKGGIDATVAGDVVRFSHAWVRVLIEGDWYEFDPAIKVRAKSNGLNLYQAMGYERSRFYSLGRVGAVFYGQSVRNFNYQSVEAELNRYAKNLSEFLANNYNDLSYGEILGAWDTVALPWGYREREALSKYRYSGANTTFSHEIPDNYKSRLSFSVSGHFTSTFFSSDIYLKSLFVRYVNDGGYVRPILVLDRKVVAEGRLVLAGSGLEAIYSVNHSTPVSGGSYGDVSGSSSTLFAIPGYLDYVLQYWGRASDKRIKYFSEIGQSIVAAGKDTQEESLSVARLGVLASEWVVEMTYSEEALESISDAPIIMLHSVGLASLRDKLVLDIKNQMLSAGMDRGYPSRVGEGLGSVLIAVAGIRASLMEASSVASVGAYDGVSTNRLLAERVRAGDRVYKIDLSNVENINTLLPEISLLRRDQIKSWVYSGLSVVVPEGKSTIGEYSGLGMLQFSPHGLVGSLIDDLGGGSSIFSSFLGIDEDWWNGLSEKNVDLEDVSYNAGLLSEFQKVSDPIDIRTGAYLFDHDDINAGSFSSPIGLGFQRFYSSDDVLSSKSGLGPGWRHNFDIKLDKTTHGIAILGGAGAISSAPSIVATLVLFDQLYGLIGGENYSPGNVFENLEVDDAVMIAVIEDWLGQQIFDNLISISYPGKYQQYVRNYEGAYFSASEAGARLEENGDGYLVIDKYGVRFQFDPDGNLVRWEDRNANQIRFHYNSAGLLQRIENDFERSLTIIYSDDFPRIESVTDENGRAVHYSYNDGNLESVRALNGEVTYYYSDPFGRIERVVLPDRPGSAYVENVYDEAGRVFQQTDAENYKSLIYVNDAWSVYKNRVGDNSYWLWDSNSNQTQYVAEDGHSTRFRYDGVGRLVRTIYPEGNSDEVRYDAFDNPITLIRHAKPGSQLDSLSTSLVYDYRFHKVSKIIDAKNNVTHNYYDSRGNLERTTGPAINFGIPETRYLYNDAGQLASITYPEGKVVNYYYDSSKGDLLREIEDFGGFNYVRSYSYDPVGNRLTETDANDNEKRFEYRPDRSLSKIVSAAPFYYERRYVYDEVARLKEVQHKMNSAPNSADNNPEWVTLSRLTYTPRGQVHYEFDADNDRITNTYDAEERAIALLDPTDRLSVTTLDSVGRIVLTERVGAGFVEGRSYKPNGTLASIVDGNGNKTSFEYDGLDRLIKSIYPDGSMQTYAYDELDNVIRLHTRSGNLLEYDYDAAGRLVREVVPGQPDTITAYNLDGKVISVSAVEGVYTRKYNTAGRLTQIIRPDQFSVGYEYDPVGNVTKLIYPDGFEVMYYYDSLSRIDRVKDSAYTDLAIYHYDELSRITGVSLNNNVNTHYAYDLDSDLLTLEHIFQNDTLSYSASYDQSGRLTFLDGEGVAFLDSITGFAKNARYQVNNLNQYTYIDGEQNEYNLDGALEKTDEAYLEYNALIQLVKHTTSDNYITDFQYDAFGRRSAVRVSNELIRYVYSDQSLIAEYNEDGSLRKRYIHGPGVDNIILHQNADGQRIYHHLDVQSSVVALSDELGNEVEDYNYRPYGYSDTVSWLGNRFRYAGRYLDQSTGLYYNRARYYDPVNGRFIQPDPAGYTDGPNLYTYAGNNPLGFRDPHGLSKTSVGSYSSNAWSLLLGVSEGFLVSTIDGAGQASYRRAIREFGVRYGLTGFAGAPRYNYRSDSDDFAYAGFLVGAILGPSKFSATKSVAPLKNASGALDYAARAARTQPYGSFSKIQFGKGQNQVDHAFRHIEKAGFSRADARTAIQKDLTHSAGSIRDGLNSRSVTVGGTRLDYHAYRLPDGTVNVGRITPPR